MSDVTQKKFDEKFTTGTGQKLVVHRKDGCSGSCPIHNPSGHHMVDWKLNWREDRGIFERICQHGIGHPDPDTIKYIAKTRGNSLARTENIHGCCGCCAPLADPYRS